jgi:hypothetical protein
VITRNNIYRLNCRLKKRTMEFTGTRGVISASRSLAKQPVGGATLRTPTIIRQSAVVSSNNSSSCCGIRRIHAGGVSA